MPFKQKRAFSLVNYAKFDSLNLGKVALSKPLLCNKLPNYTDKRAKNKKRKSGK